MKPAQTDRRERRARAMPRPAAESSPRRPRSLDAYRRVVRSLLRDSLWRFKAPAAVILFSGNAAVALQGAALVLALRYAQWIEQDELVRYFGRSWHVRTSTELLWLFAGGVAILFCIAALLTYISRTRTLALRHRYELFCSRRVLELLRSASRVTPPDGAVIASDRSVLKVARGDARYCGRGLVSLIGAIVPAVTLLAVLAGLFLLDLQLTLLLLIVMAASGVFLFRVNRKGARAGKHMEETAEAAAREYKRTLAWIRGSTFPEPSDSDWIATGLLGGKPVARHFKAYAQWLRSSENARLVSNVVAAVSFFVILGVFGARIISTGEGFGEMAVYLVALQRGLVSFRSLNQQVSGVNRLYPQIKRYFAFVDASEALVDAPVVDRPVAFRIVVNGRKLPGSLDAVDLRAPGRTGLVAPVAADRYSVPLLVDSIFGGPDAEAARYVRQSSTFATPKYEALAGRPFREAVGLPPEHTRGDLKRDLEALGFGEENVAALPVLDRPLGEDRWAKLDDGLKFALAVLAAGRSPAEWVFLDERGLTDVTDGQKDALLEALGDRHVLVVYGERKSSPGSYGEEIVAVADGELLVGLGEVSWFNVNRTAALSVLRDGPLGHIMRTGITVEEEEVEDDIDELL